MLPAYLAVRLLRALVGDYDNAHAGILKLDEDRSR